MVCEVSSVEIFHTNLALDHNRRAIVLDMLGQLSSCHVLKFFIVANIASKLRTLIHGMLLEILHGLPNNDLLSVLPALVREFTKVNAVLEDLVHLN